MNSWFNMIEALLDENEVIIKYSLSKEEMKVEFNADGWIQCGTPFTAWSETHVYFPLEYDGYEMVGRVKRDPCNESTPHQ